MVRLLNFKYEDVGFEITFLGNDRKITILSGIVQKYIGKERDYSTGLGYMHFRFYASSMGRFLKPDNLIPDITNPQNWNAYTYVKGNPINFNDPSGHMYRQIGHVKTDYAPWMGISTTPDLEEYLWGGAGGGGAGVIGTPGNTISNLLHGFDTSSLTSEELEKFTWGLILLSKTALGNATLNAIKAPGLPIEIRSFSKKQAYSGAPWGNTVTKVENGKIAGFTVTFNFHGTPFSQPAEADDSFVQFKGLKGNYKWAEILGHEFRHIEYDLTHPEEAVERVGYELRKDLSNPSYIDLKNKAHKENIYPYEKNLLKQLFLEQSMSD